MPYISATSSSALPPHKLAAIPAGNPNYRAWGKITFGISKKKQQDLNASPSLSYSFSAGDMTTNSTEKTKPVEKKFESDTPNNVSVRDNALKQQDILSSSPQPSTPPRRKSAPESYSRKPLLKVNVSQILDDLPCLLRKKSGEIVRSSLKKGKSEPTTPTFPKYVHFNTDLEQIKLFDEAQRPQAVSDVESDGFDSMSDTDEDEDEDEDEEERILVINIANMPPMTTERLSQAVFVESIFLSNDRRKLQGRVQVQNIAFEKIVSVRYTFDSWNSVSEVEATYAENVSNRDSTNNYDVFVFAIELIDNSRNPIDGKVLYFAVHYNVNGCDHWDNNGGQNYEVNFKRVSSKSSTVISNNNNNRKSQYPFSPRWSHQREALESCSPPSSNISKPTTKKSSRYDIGVSLHAAQNSHRIVSSPTVSPAISYDNDIYSSFFPNSYIDGMPGTTESPISIASSWDDSNVIDFKQLKPSTPIAIPTKPTVGSTSYYDLVNQYCYYQGSPYSAASPYASSPPVMT